MITKNITVFESFAGIGAQTEAMKNLMQNNELLKKLGLDPEKIKFKNATVYMPGELEKEAEFDEISNFMDEFVSNLAAKYKNKTLTTEEIDEIYATEIQDFNNKLSDMDLLAIPLIVLKTIDNILRYKGE